MPCHLADGYQFPGSSTCWTSKESAVRAGDGRKVHSDASCLKLASCSDASYEPTARIGELDPTRSKKLEHFFERGLALSDAVVQKLVDTGRPHATFPVFGRYCCARLH